MIAYVVSCCTPTGKPLQPEVFQDRRKCVEWLVIHEYLDESTSKKILSWDAKEPLKISLPHVSYRLDAVVL